MKALKWGLIGAGDIAKKRIAPALRDLPNCELTAVSRGRAELAEEFAEEFGARKWYADWSELVADEEIEAVYIATPVYLHCEQTIAAANAGKHVLCEKPMAMNYGECEQMIAACKTNDVKLGIAYYRHFYPVIERIKQVIESGEIGKVVFTNINAFEYFNPSADNPRRWLIEKAKSGGGPMMDFGCHRIEVLTNLFGKIRRTESIVANVAFEREVEDTATAIFQFETGTCANLTVTHAAIEPQDNLDIFGTEGSIHVAVLNRREMKINTKNGERTENHLPHQNVHQPLIEDFTEAVLNNREPLLNGEIGKMTATIEDEIYKKGSLNQNSQVQKKCMDYETIIQTSLSNLLQPEDKFSLTFKHVHFAFEDAVSRDDWTIQKSKILKRNLVNNILQTIAEGRSWLHANLIPTDDENFIITIRVGEKVGNPNPSLNVSCEMNRLVKIIN